MSVVSTLGRGAASGLSGALVWIGVSLLAFGRLDPRSAAIAGAALGVAVVAVTLVSR
ncbi:MAG: hypothetical protein ABEI80_06530 [Haloplanus sp.]